MADFEQIQSIQTVANENDLKGLLKLKIAGATEPLTISCPSLSAAEDMAGLIDGYCKLVNSGKESCWNRKGTCFLRILNVLTELVPDSHEYRVHWLQIQKNLSWVTPARFTLIERKNNECDVLLICSK